MRRVAPSPSRASIRVKVAQTRWRAARKRGASGGSVVNDRVAGHSVGEGQEGVVGAAVAVHGEHIEGFVGDGLDGGLEEGGVNSGVGGGEGQHCGHIGVDHTGALATPPMVMVWPVAAVKETAVSLGWVSVVIMARASWWPPAESGVIWVTPERIRAMGSSTPMTPVLQTRTSAASRPRWSAARRGHFGGVLVALGADASVGDAGVDDEGLGASAGDAFPVQVDGGGADGGGGEDAGDGAGLVGGQEGEVEFVGAAGFEADEDAAGGEAVGEVTEPFSIGVRSAGVMAALAGIAGLLGAGIVSALYYNLPDGEGQPGKSRDDVAYAAARAQRFRLRRSFRNS